MPRFQPSADSHEGGRFAVLVLGAGRGRKYGTLPEAREVVIHDANIVGQRVQDLQVSTDGGRSWQSGLNRMQYNFFENSSGFGSDTVSVKAIAEDGSTVVVNDIAVQGGNTKTAGSNF